MTTPLTDDAVRRPPFEVTLRARRQITALGGAVRVDVAPGGCSGTTWVFEIGSVDAPRRDDERYGCAGAWLDVSRDAGAWLPGAVVDWAGQQRPPRFRVLRNSSTAEVCPCRRSFGEAWPGPRQPTCRSYEPMPWDTEYEPPARWRRQTGWSRD